MHFKMKIRIKKKLTEKGVRERDQKDLRKKGEGETQKRGNKRGERDRAKLEKFMKLRKKRRKKEGKKKDQDNCRDWEERYKRR